MSQESNKIELSLLIFILIFSFFLASCGSSTDPTLEDKIHKGKEGIVLTFLPNSPPKQVYDKDEFMAHAFIQNKGAFDVVKYTADGKQINNFGLLTVTIDPYYLALTSSFVQSQELQLKGRSLFNPVGESQTYEYSFDSKPLQGQREHPITSIVFTLCYPYETYMSLPVCVDKDFYNLDLRKKVCKIKDLIFSEGQGAPITITKIEPRGIKHEQDTLMEFNIYIENIGKGLVIALNDDKDIFDQCVQTKSDSADWNQLGIEAVLGTQVLDCKPMPIKLIEKKGIVKCRTQQAISGSARNFLSNLQIKLSYIYQDSQTKEIEILRMG